MPGWTFPYFKPLIEPLADSLPPQLIVLHGQTCAHRRPVPSHLPPACLPPTLQIEARGVEAAKERHRLTGHEREDHRHATAATRLTEGLATPAAAAGAATTPATVRVDSCMGAQPPCLFSARRADPFSCTPPHSLSPSLTRGLNQHYYTHVTHYTHTTQRTVRMSTFRTYRACPPACCMHLPLASAYTSWVPIQGWIHLLRRLSCNMPERLVDSLVIGATVILKFWALGSKDLLPEHGHNQHQPLPRLCTQLLMRPPNNL